MPMTIPNGKSLSKLRVTGEQRVLTGQDCSPLLRTSHLPPPKSPDGKREGRKGRTIDVDVEVDPASVLERLQADNVGLVRKVVELAAVDLVWRWRTEEGEVRLEQVEEGTSGEVPIVAVNIQAVQSQQGERWYE